MRILVTGDKGFIGTNLKRHLMDYQGYDLVDGFDIRDGKQLDKHLKGIDVVIHLAALISVEESNSKPIEYIKTNIGGTTNLIEMAIKNKVKRIIYASSAACYDHTSSVYALTKYMAERQMQNYQDKINTISLRFFNIYGPGQSGYSAVINAFIKGLDVGEVTIYGKGDHTRDFIHVDDVCHAIMLAALSNVESGNVVDIGTGKAISVKGLLELIEKISNKKLKINYQKERQEVEHSKANTEAAKLLLNFKSKISLEEGLRKLIEGK